MTSGTLDARQCNSESMRALIEATMRKLIVRHETTLTRPWSRLASAVRLATAAGLLALVSPCFAIADEQLPNILLIVADDLGFSDLGCYGGEIETPHLDRLASGGVRLTQFYTTGRCCPSRASLLTGFYPHRVGLGHMTKDIGQEGYRGRVASDVKTIAEMLNGSGYRSFLSGKWHLGTDDPTVHGFEEFYGTLTSAKTFWDADHFLRLSKRGREGAGENARKRDEESSPSPSLPVSPSRFYGTDALADHAIDFLKQARRTPDKPWFLYLAFNAPHFPLHAPQETIAKYADRYDKGWDVLREQRLARMKQLGVVPNATKLTPRSPYYDWGESTGSDNPAWKSLAEDRRADLARRMAIYAAMVDQMDQNIGRVLNDLQSQRELENTLIVFTSDNGACAEWDPFGFDIKSGPHNVLHRREQIEQMGSASTYHSVGSGWANASNTPWRLYKHFNHEGGIAVPSIIHWPAGMTGQAGAIDETPTHLIDVVPTLLECADAYSDTHKASLPGKSILPLLAGEKLAGRMLFFEHEGNRAVRQGRWKLVSLRNKSWELYDIKSDRTEMHDVSAKHSAVTQRLSAAWDVWAKENHVTPLPKDYGVQYIPVDTGASVKPKEARTIARSDQMLANIFVARGFSPEVELPKGSGHFPIERLKDVQFKTVAKFDWFPEGPSYRPSDGSFFFAGKQALTRVDSKGRLHQVLGEPGGGGIHFLPDGSVLIVGHVGLRRMFPDGRVALLADGKEVGAGNDLSVGIHGEVYFSVPKEGIYRLTAGEAGRLDKVAAQGCNGLEVELAGTYLYVVRSSVQRYRIDIENSSLGKPETIFEFAKGEGGGDGCTFDAWGNLYSMRFRTGTIRVIDPRQRKLIAKIPTGVVPASNLTFGGPTNQELFVTAGAPKHNNCQVLKTSLGVTGFCGHVGATEYPVIRYLEERGDTTAFAAKRRD